jgi:uncharacterized OsmC-like protein
MHNPLNSLNVAADRARVRPAYGLACDVEHEDRSMRVDLPASGGGGSTGPHPAQLLRASLGACFLICCRLWAERLALQVDDVTLEIACEYDPISRLTDEATPPSTWERIRFDVTLVSDAAEADLVRLVDLAHRHSPMLALLAPTVERAFSLRIVRPAPQQA